MDRIDWDRGRVDGIEWAPILRQQLLALREGPQRRSTLGDMGPHQGLSRGAALATLRRSVDRGLVEVSQPGRDPIYRLAASNEPPAATQPPGPSLADRVAALERSVDQLRDIVDRLGGDTRATKRWSDDSETPEDRDSEGNPATGVDSVAESGDHSGAVAAYDLLLDQSLQALVRRHSAGEVDVLTSDLMTDVGYEGGHYRRIIRRGEDRGLLEVTSKAGRYVRVRATEAGKNYATA